MRRLLVGLTAVSVLAAATACGSSGAGEPDEAGPSGGTTTVKVGLVPSSTSPPVPGPEEGLLP